MEKAPSSVRVRVNMADKRVAKRPLITPVVIKSWYRSPGIRMISNMKGTARFTLANRLARPVPTSSG